TPVGPYGAHRRLQQLLQPSQTMPSTPSLQYVAPDGGAAHVPNVLPWAMLQMPPQQSPGFEQASPVWTQNDDASAHRPSLQSFEQHWPWSVRVLPAVWQVVLSGTNMPFAPQSPLQHELELVHAPVSGVHAVPEHLPLSQLSEQQDVLDKQAPPAAVQL